MGLLHNKGQLNAVKQQQYLHMTLTRCKGIKQADINEIKTQDYIVI